MLLEPCLGGELYAHMRKARRLFLGRPAPAPAPARSPNPNPRPKPNQVRRLDEPAARFYAACVVSAFEYMHSRNVLRCDLQPEAWHR